MNLIERVLSNLEKRKERILSGNINCIPSSLTRFRSDFIGIEQGKYYLISGHQKGAKTQFTSFLFIFEPILYAYNNQDKLNITYFYYPLEETSEVITLRFMSYLLFKLSNGYIRKSPELLKSTNEEEPLSDDILQLLRSNEYMNILKFFEKHVHFMESTNPTGIYKDIKYYAEINGTTHYRIIPIIDKLTGETKEQKIFDFYEANNPKEYVFIIIDHISLINKERDMDLRESINYLSSEYLVKTARNKYNYIPVVVQQQGMETMNLEAFKSNKIRPTAAGLSDAKYTAKDCDCMLGITNPFSFEVPSYFGYDITKFKNHIRFIEVVLNRHGNSNGITAVFFDGAVNQFNELPRPENKEELDQIYKYIDSLNKKKTSKILMLFSKLKHKMNG